MQNIKFILYLFYKYYSKGSTKSIAYFSALCAMVLLIYINVFEILILLNKVNILPFARSDSRIEKYAKMALLSLPVFLIIAFFIRPDELQKSYYQVEKVKKGGVYLICYILISMIILFVSMFFNAKHK